MHFIYHLQCSWAHMFKQFLFTTYVLQVVHAWSCIWNFFWVSFSLIANSLSNSACCFWCSASCNLRSSSAVWGASLSNSNSCSRAIAACWCDWSFLSSCDTVACFSWREHDRASTSLLRRLMFALQASICCDLSSDSFFVSVSCCYKMKTNCE